MRILLVEDNPADVRFVREALKEAGADSDVQVVETGEQALAFLKREGVFGDADSPELILLDLNLPGMTGHELLRQIKERPGLRRIPVVVFTSSREQADIDAAYESHANCYVVKPLHFKDYVTLLGEIERCWSGTVKKPTVPSRWHGL